MTTQKPKSKIQRVHVQVVDPVTRKSMTRTYYDVTPEEFFQRIPSDDSEPRKSGRRKHAAASA